MNTLSMSRPPSRPVRLGTAYAAVFLAAALTGAGVLDPLGRWLVDGFDALARAQYRMHLATRNVNADGRAEYAVLLRGDADRGALERWAGGAGDATVRDSAIPGWLVLGVAPERGAAFAAELREQPFSRAVLRNRGLWICH